MADGCGLYKQLARVLEYPDEEIPGKIDAIIDTVSKAGNYSPEVVEELELFAKEVAGMSLDDLQGIYSYTFEMSADFTLDIGYFQYEGFKRANTLVTIKSMYKEEGFPYEESAGGELPDHLPLILRFLDFVKKDQLRDDFRESFVIKGIEKLKKNFNDKKKRDPYCHLINALWMVVDRDVKGRK